MPTYTLLSEEDLEKKIFNSQMCFQREVVIVDGATSTKPIIFTWGVATCSVCIIYDPITRLTLFSHIDESIRIKESQSKLLDFLKEKNIDISKIKVFLAGGRFTQPSSRRWAEELRQFWKKIVKENLNDELLLKRDCFALDLDEAWDWIKKKTTKKEYKDFNTYIFYLKENESDEQLDISYLYLSGQREDPIARRITNILVDLCKEKKLIEHTDYPLLGVQMVNSEDLGEKVLIDLQIPNKTTFPIIGFDAQKGEMFIVNDFCKDIIENLIEDLGIKIRLNTSININDHEVDFLNEIQDKFSLANKYQTSSPLSQSNIAFLTQKKANFHNEANDIFYIKTDELTKDVREELKLDRRKLTKVKFEQLRFLRANIPGITIEVDSSDPTALSALVTFSKSKENLEIMTAVVNNWEEIKKQSLAMLESQNIDEDKKMEI